MHKKIILKISGMTCASCSRSNEKELQKAKGIISASVNFASKKALVEYDSDVISLDEIIEVIKNNGYDIADNQTAKYVGHKMMNSGHGHVSEDADKNWNDFFRAGLLSLPLLLEMFFKIETGIRFFSQDLIFWINLFLATFVVVYFGRRFHRMTLKQLKKLQANMDTLVSLGTLAAYFYSLWAVFSGQEGYFETAAIIIVLILLGKYFEAKSTGMAGEAMKKLMELGVKKARIIVEGKEQEIEIDKVKVGDVVLIKPSEKIPLDGEVILGISSIDESMLTGESLPTEKKTGSKVFGGTLNQEGILKVRITQIGEGTVLAQIIQTVEEAQGSKAPIQKLADKVSGIFVPIVIALSFITFLAWYFFSGDVSRAIINAVAVLVIACPCALGLATPTAIMTGTGRGSKNGILFKSGESFERAKNITLVVFDKTGTLTRGKPELKNIQANPEFGFAEDRVLKIAGSLAKNSEHPLSQAVARYASNKNIALAELDNFQEIRGQGIVAKCREHGTAVMLGNKKLLENNWLETEWPDKILDSSGSKIGTSLFVVHGKQVIGALTVADEIRKEAREVVEKIRKLGLKITMITGDNKKTAEYVGEALGIKRIISEVLPHQKSEEVKNFQKQREKVIFIGDGINDAPSLVQADLGIALGNATDIAKEAGQIILIENNLKKVIEAINISQITFKTIRQNLFWAFFYNVVAIPLAAFGILSPVISALAMSMSSVTVVFNSLRILRRS